VTKKVRRLARKKKAPAISESRILLFCEKDWANLAFTLSETLRSVGIEADAFKLRKHGSEVAQQRPRQAEIIVIKDFIKLCKEYDIIVFMHSGQNVLIPQNKYKRKEYEDNIRLVKRYMRNNRKKTYVGFHGSSFYRRYHKKINLSLNKYVCGSIVQTGDLLDLGAKNETWIQAPVDLSSLNPNFDLVNEKLTFAHHPSLRGKKNSDMIDDLFERLSKEEDIKDKFVYRTGERVSHSDNMKRVGTCDVYIDHQAYTLYNKPYGEFGIAALEAAALGKISISCTKKQERYEEEYGKLGMLVSNSPDELELLVRKLIAMDKGEILELKKQARKWVEEYHSYQYIGDKLKRFFEQLVR